MPIVNEKYETKLSTTYRTPREGVEAIRAKVAKSRRVRISSIPMSLLKDLIPDLAGKDVKIVLPRGSRVRKELKALGPVAVTRALVYKDHRGAKATVGSVGFPDLIFHVIWVDDLILNVDAMEYGTCVKCLSATFDLTWRYAKR